MDVSHPLSEVSCLTKMCRKKTSPHSDVEVKMYLLRMYSAEVTRLLLVHLLSAMWMLIADVVSM